ncbi:hypothetical protein [Streptomyces sp. NPDC047079]|uniref:hypothetical protein n=1 Tax=Streptomyces sp. NPDC047079 TaxID=3154607 RepID=UPI0033F8723E
MDDAQISLQDVGRHRQPTLAKDGQGLVVHARGVQHGDELAVLLRHGLDRVSQGHGLDAEPVDQRPVLPGLHR